MDKKGIIAVSLAFLTLIVWQLKFAPKYTPPPPPAAADTSSTPQIESASTPAPASALAVKPATPSGEAATEEIETASSPLVEYRFTNRGGGIATALLRSHLAENGGYVTLNEHGRLPIAALSDQPGEDALLDYKVTVNQQAGEVLCERTTPTGLRIVKKFALPKGETGSAGYLVNLDVSFINGGADAYQSPGYYIYAGSAALIHKNDLPTYTSFDWYRGKMYYKDVNWFSEGKLPLIGVRTSPEKAFFSETSPDIWWAGVRNQYFATIVTALGDKGTSVWARRFPMTLADQPSFGIEGALGMPGFTLQPNESKQEKFSLWIGPKEYGLLKKLGHEEDEIMNFGMFKIVSQFLLSAMNTLHSILWNSYAAAIIVLTLCIKTGMWPLQNKATNSMKKMQVLQPKMTELREKYKDDPTRMNQELMKLYKEYGVNPFSGCLPMVVQIPIFFGFYAMLGTAIELRNSKFLWVQDLSQPDTVWHIPGLGFPVNILPLCMAATMLWQMSLTPKSGDAVQQRVFMFVPLIFIFFCYNFASALALYWTVQNLFSIVQLYVTRNQAAPQLQRVVVKKKK